MMASDDSIYAPNYKPHYNWFETAHQEHKDVKWELSRGEWYEHPLDRLPKSVLWAMQAWLEFKRMPKHRDFVASGWNRIVHDFRLNAPEMFKEISSIFRKLETIHIRLFPYTEPGETPIIITKEKIHTCYADLKDCLDPAEAKIKKLEADCIQEIKKFNDAIEEQKHRFFARRAGKE